MAKTEGKAVLRRIDKRLKALGLTDNGAGIRAGSRDLVRSIRRQLRDGKQRGISTQSLERLAPVLETTAAWLLSESGPETTRPDDPGAEHATVPVKGFVAAGAAAHYLPLAEGELDRVDAPAGANEQTVAFEIRGDSLGELFDRWLVFFDDVRSPVTTDLVGKLCVVGLSDGRVMIKKLRRGGGDLWDLHSNTEAPVRGVAVDWAARVKIMTPR